MFAKRDRIQGISLDRCGILVMDDHATEVDQAIADFLKRSAK